MKRGLAFFSAVGAVASLAVGLGTEGRAAAQPAPPDAVAPPPPTVVATVDPVYYEGHPAYWYGGHWYWRDVHGWHWYATEPAVLHDRRVHSPPARYHYERRR